MYKQNKNSLMTQPSNVASLEVYSLAASEPNKTRNFLWSADANINASLHLVILFKSMAPIILLKVKNNNSGHLPPLFSPSVFLSLPPSLFLSLSFSLTGEERVRTLFTSQREREREGGRERENERERGRESCIHTQHSDRSILQSL